MDPLNTALLVFLVFLGIIILKTLFTVRTYTGLRGTTAGNVNSSGPIQPPPLTAAQR